MQTGSKELIRDINFHLILEAIINEGPISRAALAKHLGLTKATVSSIVQELLDSGLVREVGSAPAEKGRKPILLSLHQRPDTHLPSTSKPQESRLCPLIFWERAVD